MSENVQVSVTVDTSEATANIKELQRFADKVSKDVMATKREALKEVRQMRSQAVRMMSGVRQLFYAFGGALDPFLQAVFNIVGSSIEMLYALATAEGSTILGLPAAAVHAGIAIAIQAVTLPQILAGIEGAQTSANRAIAAVDALALFGGI